MLRASNPQIFHSRHPSLKNTPLIPSRQRHSTFAAMSPRFTNSKPLTLQMPSSSIQPFSLSRARTSTSRDMSTKSRSSGCLAGNSTLLSPAGAGMEFYSIRSVSMPPVTMSGTWNRTRKISDFGPWSQRMTSVHSRVQPYGPNRLQMIGHISMVHRIYSTRI